MDKLTIADFKKMLRNALVCITERPTNSQN